MAETRHCGYRGSGGDHQPHAYCARPDGTVTHCTGRQADAPPPVYLPLETSPDWAGPIHWRDQ